ncbi:ATP-dependent RNA helicase [Trypanosoma rangeli]|uniref:ATP-dependent RNA helicase n=1 Tax=Trypanosoma rangeli TaxID=5698 RepID=A0A3S5IQN1_TRYRA|nr:ATP-dependent RNA helicase [Trypanosoma rangeli]RNF01294.1 ATP-dependent RNA helicase [Trypanosoma rangeli]|eukprot:RNF01294.1 ATP-dependent RNA helicase [Trypanosoma rangeli]
MATVLRHGRKGGKVSSSPAVGPRAITPGSAMSPVSLQAGGEGTTIISDLSAAHPFDPDAIANVAKKASTSEANVLQFDMEAIQHIGKGVMVGRTKQVRTTTRQPQVRTTEAVLKLRNTIGEQKTTPESLTHPLALEKLTDHDVLVVHTPRDAMVSAVSLSMSKQHPKVLVVVPKYFEVTPVRRYLTNLTINNLRVMAGEFCGQTFQGFQSDYLWVTSAEMALLCLTKLQSMAPFSYVVVPGHLGTSQLVSCFVKAFAQWMLSGAASTQFVRLVVTSDRRDQNEFQGMFGRLRVAFDQDPVKRVTEFSYGETCALVEKEMMEMEQDGSGTFPPPTKRLIDYTAKLSADVVQCIIKGNEKPQVIAVFTAEARNVLIALQEAHLEDCAIYSGFQNTEDTTNAKHRVCVMNHVRHALGVDDDCTMVIDMGTIRRPAAQHKSESFMAASTTEWETKVERAGRLSLLERRQGCCYFALYPDEVSAAFSEDATSLPDVFDVEDAFVHCARLNIPKREVAALLPAVPAETAEHVLHNLAEKSIISSTQDFAITFVGEVASRLPVDLDIASFIIGGCNLGLGEAALAIGSVAALPFRSITPLTCSSASWDEFTNRSRDQYADEIAPQSDLLADTLVFLEWLTLRIKGESTTWFLEETLIQEFRLINIENLMKYMREQLKNYVFLDRVNTPESLINVASAIRGKTTILLLLASVALARRTAFIRDAGHLNEKDRYASMAFVRTSKRVVPHTYIPSSIKWETGKIMVPVILKNSTNILAGVFSLIHAPYFFASLLLLYPSVEYSKPVIKDNATVVYFGVSCNRQMKRFVVSIEDAVRILDFRDNINLALGCMQALRTSTPPISRITFSLSLKSFDRHFDIGQLHKDICSQLLELVNVLKVTEYQGSFETYVTHCTAPRELLPKADIPAHDEEVLRWFVDGTVWEKLRTPSSAVMQTSSSFEDGPQWLDGVSIFAANYDDYYDDVEIMSDSYFMCHGPLIEDDDDW